MSRKNPNKDYETYRFCSRKMKKAIKNYPKSKNTKLGRYVDECFTQEYEYFYEGGGEIWSYMTNDSEKQSLVLNLYRGKTPFRVIYKEYPDEEEQECIDNITLDNFFSNLFKC